MNGFFSLLEQLVSLTAPSIAMLQSLLGVTLAPVPNDNKHWYFCEGHSTTGLIDEVDYRDPGPGATKPAPFLVLKLRNAPIRIDGFRKRYGKVYPTDISIHHPHFVGYTFIVNGRPVRVNADSKTDAVLSISIDYSDQGDEEGRIQQVAPAVPSRSSRTAEPRRW